MACLIWTEPAIADLEAIADYIALDKPDAVAPREISAPVQNGVIRHTLPAWSHTVLRVPR